MNYRAIVSSDWNECLAPCGPFDPILFLYPNLEGILSDIFRMYTSNRISLGEAIRKIGETLPAPVTREQMDAYLEKSFLTYRGVSTLIEECLRRDILFMINTTGMMGYFQRVFAKALLPQVPSVAANPFISFPIERTDPPLRYRIEEIQDKARNTEHLTRSLGIPGNRVVLIGDSGGDGPHFEWGKSVGAFLIGSMTKPSLESYCLEKGILLDLRFGLSYKEGQERNLMQEMETDFALLIDSIEEAIG